MKKLVLGLVLMLAYVSVYADTVIPTSSGGAPCSSLAANLTSMPIDLSGWGGASFQVVSTGGSVATVQLQKRNSSAEGWATVVTVTNPATDELGYDGPAIGEVRVVVAWTSGTLNCSVVRKKSS